MNILQSTGVTWFFIVVVLICLGSYSPRAAAQGVTCLLWDIVEIETDLYLYYAEQHDNGTCTDPQPVYIIGNYGPNPQQDCQAGECIPSTLLVQSGLGLGSTVNKSQAIVSHVYGEKLFKGLAEPFAADKDFPLLHSSPRRVLSVDFVQYIIDEGDPVKAKLYSVIKDVTSLEPHSIIPRNNIAWIAFEIKDFPKGVKPIHEEVLTVRKCQGAGAYSLTCPGGPALLLTVARE